MKLSIVIPSYRDPFLFKTIQSILDNSELGDQLEVIAVWDGYYPPADLIIDDPRVKYLHLGQNRGMRGAINAGVAIAKGEFIGRMDEHCRVAKGMDKELTDTCKENEVMTPRRYFLNPIEWKIMEDKGYRDYEKLVIQDMGGGVRKFSGKEWKERTEKRKNVQIDETEAMQGSFWIANREFFLKTVGELSTENFGQLIQDSVEVCMQYWKTGGRLMLNKNTWFAHKHRDFKRTHNNGSPENPAQYEKGYKYALDKWEGYYVNELRPKWDSMYANEK